MKTSDLDMMKSCFESVSGIEQRRPDACDGR